MWSLIGVMDLKKADASAGLPTLSCWSGLPQLAMPDARPKPAIRRVEAGCSARRGKSVRGHSDWPRTRPTVACAFRSAATKGL